MSSTFRRRGLTSLDSSLQYHLLLAGLKSIPCFSRITNDCSWKQPWKYFKVWGSKEHKKHHRTHITRSANTHLLINTLWYEVNVFKRSIDWKDLHCVFYLFTKLYFLEFSVHGNFQLHSNTVEVKFEHFSVARMLRKAAFRAVLITTVHFPEDPPDVSFCYLLDRANPFSGFNPASSGLRTN